MQQLQLNAVNHWFTVEDVLEDENKREAIFKILHI